MNPRDRTVGTAVWTVPNLLSMFRLALVPVFLVLVVQGLDIAALLTLVVASITDWLDGYLARRWDQLTRLGQLLDPSADRLFIVAALVGLAFREVVPSWLVGIVLARDILLLALGIVLANLGYGPLPVHRLGKIATFCLLVGLPLLMVGPAFPAIAPVSQPLAWAVSLWGVFLYWWAGAQYARETFRLARRSGRGRR